MLYRTKHGNAPWGIAQTKTKALNKKDISEWPTVDPYDLAVMVYKKGNVAALLQQAYARLNGEEFGGTSIRINYWPDAEDTSCLTGTLVKEEF